MSHPLKDSTNDRINNKDCRIQELENAHKQCADELVKADERAAVLSSEIKKLKSIKAEMEEKFSLLNEKLEARDKEIFRLNQLYKGSQNLDIVAMEHTVETTKSSIQKLNNQIDFLNRENQRLETENKEKDQIINTAEKYKQERMTMGQKYVSLQNENKALTNDIKTMEGVINELKDKIEENSSVFAKRKLVPLSDLSKQKQR